MIADSRSFILTAPWAVIFPGPAIIALSFFVSLVGGALAEVLRGRGRSGRHQADARVRQLLNQVGLPASAAGCDAADFPGGQRRRIGIARAPAAEACRFWLRWPYRLDLRCASETPPLRAPGPGHEITCSYEPTAPT
jgi:hypothetical protein